MASEKTPECYKHACIFACEPGLSTSHVAGALQLLLARHHEWRHSQSLFILNADVAAAFDNLGPDE
eukprot:1546972-Lingulodinium_polyedra.AAC.1